ncbi:hypothetical protein SIID45300_02260 [Candidatus Magnetaquicoccaceae bacterium FCR-1]|uniref:TerB-C domain-containing protein n=2 Tax=Candidatus Magnetaquiglobus chichijimensis TaxID=3141448 RepID=A0ABQ0CAL9_9PROT
MIDPSLEVTSHPIDLILKLTSYWPDYATLHPDARRAYLQWLAGDRREKEIDIGYLFLFYYGLERRALIDAKEDSDAQADIPSIAREIRRLLAIHESNDSFRNYATAFLDYLESATIEPEIYVQTLPKARRSHPLPLRLRIALGQLAVDRQPLPAEWALVWVLSDPNRLLRTPVKRCVEAFATLFKVKYSELFGTGMRLRANQTRLTISYRAASGKLNGMEFKRQLNHLPEISAQSAPQAKLQEVIDLCATLLEPYSRFIARHPERDKSHEALLLLPSACWPDALTSEFLALQEQSRHEMRVMRFDGLMERLRCSPPLTREMLSALASAFSINRIGMAPDFEEGRKRFKPDEWVVLYPVEDEDHTPWNTPIYQGCVTTVELACLVALADDIERLAVPTLTRLTDQIDSWAHLLPGQRQRLKAHMRLSLAQPPRLTTLKKRLQPMTLDARHAVAKFLAHLAEADGIITPGEVKQLERIYQALQLDVQMLYADLHGVSAQRLDNKSVHRTHATGVKCADSGITHEMAPSPGKPRDAHPAAGVEADASRVRLDFARIDQLQQETESVTTLLAQLFAGETAEAHPAAEPTRKAEPESVEPPLFGLSSEHVAFLRHLVMRPTWSRQELSDLAADMDLMLDGTLELLNDVIIGLFEMDLYEGEDPVEILQHQPLLEKLSA